MNLTDREIESIFEEFKPLVKAKAGLYFILGADTSDLIQEGMIGLFNAIKTYDESGGASFKTYASICINRQMISAVKAAARQKNSPLNEAVSFDTPLEDGHMLGDSLIASLDESPENAVILGDMIQLLLSENSKVLTALERSILSGMLRGKGYREIAEALGKSPKSIDNGMQRIRTKIRKFLEE